MTAASRPSLLRSVLLSTAALLLTLLMACQPEQTEYTASEIPEAPNGGVAGDVMMEHLLTQAATAGEKLISLAEAMPEETYGWRPQEGVRSVGEVFAHVAADNYLLPVIMGVPAPAETGITSEYATAVAFEGVERSKEEIVAALKASFQHMEAAAQQTRGELSAELNWGGTTFTTGSLWTMTITHLHEHLGQGIAYARSNGVTPPWSM
jgi:uncharacterized damage-inducible protein DinB